MSAKRASGTQRKRRAPERRPDPLARRIARVVHRHRALIALGLAAVHLLLAALSFLPTPHTGGDNAAYLALARSLLVRHAYLEIYDPAAPPHTQYPPVYPGILALALVVGLQPWAHIKALIAVFSAGAVAFTFLWGVRRRRPLLALGVAALLALSPGVLELTHWELSDVPFWFFTVLALWGWERLRPRETGRLVVAIVATTLAYFTRSAGLPLLVAALGFLALRRRWPQLAALAGVVLPLALLWWLRAQAQGGVDYVEQFWLVNPYDPSQGRAGITDLFARAFENQSKYASIHLPMLLADSQAAFLMVPSALVTLFGVYGWLCRMRRPGVAELFLPLYVGLLFVWPAVWSGERFLLPVFGMLLLYAGDGVIRVARILRVRPQLTAAVTAAALLVFALPGIATQIRVGHQCRAFGGIGDRYPCLSEPWRDFFIAAEWTGSGLPADAVVIARKPRLFWALSGLPARIFPFDTVPDLFFDAAENAGARYLLLDAVDGLSRVYVTPILARRTQAFCLMRVAPRTGTAVFGILPDARTAQPAASPDAAGRDVPFRVCPPEYFGNPADRDALMRGMAAASPGGGA